MVKVPLLVVSVVWRERKMSRLRSLFDISEFFFCFIYSTYIYLTWRIVGVGVYDLSLNVEIWFMGPPLC